MKTFFREIELIIFISDARFDLLNLDSITANDCDLSTTRLCDKPS